MKAGVSVTAGVPNRAWGMHDHDTLCGVDLGAQPCERPVTYRPAGDFADQVTISNFVYTPGDMTILRFSVFQARSGRRIGAGHGYCVRTDVGRASTCTANSSLPGGRIVLQWEAHDGDRAFRAAIIGGTGRYVGQTGELTFRVVS
ncbi:MAG: hypothetical protein E6G10_22460 [Actinobacteria bacterium]|nr:MAG: hypothetical protein E6G10_22460 [Actinomycetota bacterium]